MASPFINSLVSGQLAARGPINQAITHPSGLGSFWTGADGNVYVAGSQGVHSAGKADANTNAYWTSKGFRGEADPNAPKTPAAPTNQNGGNGGGTGPGGPSNPNNTGGGGGSSAPVYEDKSGDIGVNQAGYDSVDSQVKAGTSHVDDLYNKIVTGYNTEKNTNEGDYTAKSNTNENNLQKNKDAAKINAAQGRRGLFGTLSSLGALNGDGITLANNAVQNGANKDLSGAADNFATNQSGLDKSIGDFRLADAKRRADAQTEADNEKTAVKGQGAKDRQVYLSKIADDYQLENKLPEAADYRNRVAALFPEIAAANVPTSGLTSAAAPYTAASLASYLAQANGTQVTTAPGASGASGVAGLPGLIASNKKRA